MLAAIKHGLGNLINFRGRDARQAFWYYVLFIYVLAIVITVVVFVPMMIQTIASAIQQSVAAARSGDPVAVQIASHEAVAGSVAGMMSTMIWLGSATGVLMLVLVAASFVRRLHDSDLSGWWALLPGAAQLANLILTPTLMSALMEDVSRVNAAADTLGVAAFRASFGAASLLGWGAIILVILLGVRKSTPGPNRYGEAPFTA